MNTQTMNVHNIKWKLFRQNVIDMNIGGISAMFATLFTNPIEVVKTRMQLQGELKARGKHSIFYKNVPHALYVIARNEGIVALQNGLPAMLGFQYCLNVFRLGSYRIAEHRGFLVDKEGNKCLYRGAAVAGVGGGVGSIVGTPFYLVKTRMQSHGAKAIAVGHQHDHTGLMNALRHIYSKEGFKGLFRGVQPQIARGMSGSASQILGFTYAKEWLVKNGLFVNSPLMLSFFGANIGGILMTVCLSPFDVIATRLSNQPVDAQYRGKLYSGMYDRLLHENGTARRCPVFVQGTPSQLFTTWPSHCDAPCLLGPAQKDRTLPVLASIMDFIAIYFVVLYYLYCY